jgi:putative transposase
VRYPLSPRNVEDLLAERSHETVRFWWNRFGPMFAAEIRKKRVSRMRAYPQWRWHLDEAFCRAALKRETPDSMFSSASFCS